MPFAREATLYLAGRFAQFAAYIVVLPALTRLLDGQQYGRLALALVIQQTLVAIAPVGLTSVAAFPIYERGAKGRLESERMVMTTGLVAVVVLALVQLCAPVWLPVVPDAVGGALPLLAIWTALPMVLQSACLSLLQAEGRAGAFVVSTLISVVGGQAFGLVMLWEWRSPAAYLAGVLLGAVGGTISAVAALRLRPRAPVGWDLLIRGLRHGGPTVPHLVGTMVLALGDRVVVGRVLGVVEVGHYQVAYTIGSVGFSVLYAVNNAWGPLIYRAPEAVRWDLLSQSMSRMLALVCGLVAAISWSAPLGVAIGAPSSFPRDTLVPVVCVVVVSLFFDLLYLSGVHVLFRVRRTFPLTFLMPAASVVNLSANVVLVPRLGIAGAAWSTVLGYAVAGTASRLFARRCADVRWPHRDEVLAALWCAFAVAGGALLPQRGVWLALRVTSGALVALGVAWFVLSDRTGRSGAAPFRS